MNAIQDIKELPDTATTQAKNPQLYGGIAGLVVGAAVGGLYASKISFSFIPKVGSKIASLVGFLLGAGVYGYGLSSKIELPTFNLGSEESDWVGFTGDGRVIGLQAEDVEEEFGQNFRGRTTGNTVMRADEEEDTSASHDHVPDFSPKTFNPTMTDTTMGGVPSWTTSGLTNPSLPEYDSAVRQGMVMPMRGSVTQWYGSAEGVTHSVMGSSVGNNFSMTEGVGSVIGQ